MGGKAVVMLTSVIGTLYMAMPLSIIGNRFFDIYNQLEELKRRPVVQKLKRYAMLVRSFNKTNGLKNLLKPGAPVKPGGAIAQKQKPKNSLFDCYKDDIEGFYSIKSLYSINTADLASIIEAQSR